MKRVSAAEAKNTLPALLREAEPEPEEIARHPTPDKCILAFSTLIERLPTRARRAWDRASLRRFNVGFQVSGGPAPGTFVTHLRAATVKRVADLNGEITTTIYPVDPE